MPTSRTISFSPADIHECVQHLFPPDEGAVADAADPAVATANLDKPENITLEQCANNEDMMMAKVQWLIAKGDDDGYPARGEVPAKDVVYVTETKAHKQLIFLNKYTVYKVLEELRDRGLFPCICKDTPFGRWCNFAIVLNVFAILYCHIEGLF